MPGTAHGMKTATICALKRHPVYWETVRWVPSFVSSFRAGRGLGRSTFQMVKLRSERSGDLSNASSEGGVLSSRADRKVSGDHPLPQQRHSTAAFQDDERAFENEHSRSTSSGPGTVLGAAYLPLTVCIATLAQPILQMWKLRLREVKDLSHLIKAT